MPEFIRVKVTASAKTEVVQEKNGVLLVSVREPREENRANARVMELVAAFYKKKPADLMLIKGHHHSQKLFKLR